MSKRMMAMFVAVAVLQSAFAPVLRAQTREGIAVHGHWAIEVREPDGTLVMHVEFENALTTQGQTTLTRLFSREVTLEQWQVRLVAAEGLWNGLGITGLITEDRDGPFCFAPPVDASHHFRTLTVARGPLSNVILRGEGTVETAGRLRTVYAETSVHTTASSVGCSHADFTSAQVPAVIEAMVLSPGQKIQVTVTFTFS